MTPRGRALVTSRSHATAGRWSDKRVGGEEGGQAGVGVGVELVLRYRLDR